MKLFTMLSLLSCWFSVLLFPIILIPEVDLQNTICGENNSSEILHFTSTPGNLQRTCPGWKTSLHCCMTGYINLIWQRWDKTNDTWLSYYNYLSQHNINSRRYLVEKSENQTLTVESAGAEDAGKYRCLGRSRNGTLLDQIFKFDVLPKADCDHWDDNPMVISPEKKVYKRLPEQKLEVLCEGFYGNATIDSEYWLIDWWFKNGIDHVDQNVTTSSKKLPQGMQARLVINSVKKEDYGIYVCAMETGSDDRKTYVRITLQEGEGNLAVSSATKSIWWPIGGVGVFLPLYICFTYQ